MNFWFIIQGEIIQCGHLFWSKHFKREFPSFWRHVLTLPPTVVSTRPEVDGKLNNNTRMTKKPLKTNKVLTIAYFFKSGKNVFP